MSDPVELLFFDTFAHENSEVFIINKLKIPLILNMYSFLRN